jgi:hypothetical protein
MHLWHETCVQPKLVYVCVTRERKRAPRASRIGLCSVMRRTIASAAACSTPLLLLWMSPQPGSSAPVATSTMYCRARNHTTTVISAAVKMQ